VRTSGLVVFALCATVLMLQGCATGGNAGTAQKAPAARYNLAGYPPPFRDGFNAGCDAAKRKAAEAEDKARYTSDSQYRAGWKDGQSVCKPK